MVEQVTRVYFETMIVGNLNLQRFIQVVVRGITRRFIELHRAPLMLYLGMAIDSPWLELDTIYRCWS